MAIVTVQLCRTQEPGWVWTGIGGGESGKDSLSDSL